MRLLITGATGFIGRRLITHALGQGHEVTALLRRPGALPAGVSIAEGDLADGRGLDAAVRQLDAVVHLAAITKSARLTGYQKINGEGTGRLCAALSKLDHPPALVYCSSLAAAGPSTPQALRAEDAPAAPVSAYGRGKLAGEAAVQAVSGQVPSIILRPSIVYGPGDREFLPFLIAIARTGILPVVGSGERWYSVLHVDDLCRALLAAIHTAQTPAAKPYFLSDGTPARIEELAAAVAHALGRRRPRRITVPFGVAATAAHAVRWLRGSKAAMFNPDKVHELIQPAWTCGNERAMRNLGLKPFMSFQDGLAGSLLRRRDA